MSREEIDRLRSRLQSARRITALTGAGISADSGIPTFRGSDGLWKNFRPEELATPDAFRRDPATVWEWYDWRRRIIATKAPNPGHIWLARMEKRWPSFHLITQNVDGLHALAGSRRLIEMHGNIWKTRCTRCGVVEEDRRVPLPIPPSCSTCGALLRPHVVWFGESLDPEELATCMAWLRDAEVFFVIGTSGVVQPAASFAGMARQAGSFVVEINLEPTPITEQADCSIRGRAADTIPRLLGES